MTQNQITAIFGMKGYGKTTIANRIARRARREGFRVVVLAPFGGFRIPGAVVLDRVTPETLGRLNGRSVVVNVQSDSDAKRVFDFVWRSQERADRPLLLVVDECEKWFGTRPDPNLRNIIHYGRHRLISTVLISQRPASVHNDGLAQADIRIVFRTIEVNDLDYLRKFTGADPEELAQLQLGKYLIYGEE